MQGKLALPRQLFPTVRGYRRAWLGRDLLAGITFFAVAVPGQLATANLAGMPPATGLIGFLAGALMVTVLATNPRLTIYSDSTIAPLLAAGVLSVAAAGSVEYQRVAIVTTVMVGVLVLAVGVFRMGWISEYLSRTVATGFLGGIAVTIFVTELPVVLGVDGDKGRPVAQLLALTGTLGQINWLVVAVSAVGLAILLGSKRIDPRFPGALILMTGAILASYWLDLGARGVGVVGSFPDAPPMLSVPDEPVSVFMEMVPTAVAIALVALMQTATTTRVAALDGGYKTDIDADMRALGAGNVLSGFFGGFTVDGSPPTTSLMGVMKTRSQLASLFAAILVLILLLFASTVLQQLPEAILGVVLIFISARIFDVKEMRAIRRFSTSGFVVMLVTMAGVVVFGVAGGLVLAFLVDIGDRARRDGRPQVDRLMQNNKGRWTPAEGPIADESTLVTVYRVNGPLWFGNMRWVRNQLLETVHHDGEQGRVLVLDLTGVEDIDYTASRALEQLIVSCGNRHVELAIVGNRDRLLEMLSGSSFVRDLGKDHIFRTISRALNAVGPGRGGDHPPVADQIGNPDPR